MNAEQGFQAQVLDGIRLLDILANPFSDYLNEIVIDISRDVNDNPAILKIHRLKARNPVYPVFLG